MPLRTLRNNRLSQICKNPECGRRFVTVVAVRTGKTIKRRNGRVYQYCTTECRESASKKRRNKRRRDVRAAQKRAEIAIPCNIAAGGCPDARGDIGNCAGCFYKAKDEYDCEYNKWSHEVNASFSYR